MSEAPLRPVLAVAGSAPNALDDLRGLFFDPILVRNPDVMAVGLDAVRLLNGRINCRFVVTNHREDVLPIQDLMAAARIGDAGWPGWRLIAPQPWPGVDIVEPYFPPDGRSGSSAMTGALAALRLGYARIVLCGCPLTGNAPEGNPYEAFRLGWEDRQFELAGKVRSMSGWTMGLLGYPDKEWIDG